MFKIFLLCTIFLKVFIESVTVLVLFCFVCFSPEACGISAPCCCCSVAKLCPTLCDPMDCNSPGSSVCGILQARILAAAAAKSLQSCPTLCDPIDGSPPGSPVPGILQARTLEWVAMSFSNA